MGGEGHCFEILSLSYKHLHVHLKPCFLYMATFPEDNQIGISSLVKQWVAEGILKPIRYRSLEEIAEDNFKDLIDRNLVMIQEYSSKNKIKTCTIHDLSRDLCRWEAQKEKFRGVTMMHSLNSHSRVVDVIQQSYDQEELKSTSAKLPRLLRVLVVDCLSSSEEIVRLVNDFNALYFPNLFNSLESLSVPWNLQTITISGDGICKLPLNLPAEIWEMPQLRHLKREAGDFYLPDPPSTNDNNVLVLYNLQTLYKIRNFRSTYEVVGRIPNLKKLGITYREFPSGFGWDYYEVHNLSHLHNLESLFLDSDENLLSKNICFPRSLKKLTLEKCGLCWEDLTVIGSLSHLEVLNLMRDAVKGPKWKPVEGQFLQLKFLRIYYTDLVKWIIADSSHFPLLEKLQLGFLEDLKEIPYGIGEIPTL